MSRPIIMSRDDEIRRLREDLENARATAKFWQEQYGHANPEHEWEPFKWEEEHE